MTAPEPTKLLPDYVGQSGHRCPKCGGHMSRVKRRLLDHLFSLFVPTQRYRCRSFSCQWEGNLRIDKGARDTPAR